jgi:hypothetical protein
LADGTYATRWNAGSDGPIRRDDQKGSCAIARSRTVTITEVFTNRRSGPLAQRSDLEVKAPAGQARRC